MLGEQALGERVERADGGAVELFEGPLAASPRLPRPALGLGRPLELGPDAVAQFGPRLLGEGDGGDAAELGLSSEDQGQHALDQGRGLAGPGAGLDEEGGVEVLGDP